MSDQDWIIADLNGQRLVQDAQITELREDLRKAERTGAEAMRERCVEQVPSQRDKQKLRALTLPGD